MALQPFNFTPDPVVEQPATTTFFEGLRNEEIERLSVLAHQAQQFEPDTYANALKIGGGLPPELVMRNLQGIEQQRAVDIYRNIFTESPRLRAWALSDTEVLRLVRPEELQSLSGLSWLGAATSRAWEQGAAQLELAQLRSLEARGLATFEQIRRANELSERTPFDVDSQNYFAQAWTGAVESLPYLLHIGEGAVAGAAAGIAGGFVVGGPAGAAAGAGLGGVVGTFNNSYNLNVGLAYEEYIHLRDENGQPLSRDVARVASLLAALPAAMFESIGLGLIASRIPGLSNIVAGVTGREAMRVALRNPAFRAALERMAGDTAFIIGTEVTQETLQEMAIFAGGELAQLASGQPFAEVTATDYMNRIAQTIQDTIQIMSVMGPIMALPGAGVEFVNARTSVVDNARIRQVAEELQDNAFLDRAPAQAAAAIDAQTLDQQVTLPADEFVELYQELGEDPFAIEIDGWQDRLREALEVGGDVQLSLGEFLAYLVRDPADNPLLDLVKATPSGYSNAEIEAFAQGYVDRLQGTATPGEAAPAPGTTDQVETGPPLSVIGEDVMQRLEAAGVDAEAARPYAQLIQSFYQTMGERLARNPNELYAEQALEVRRSTLEQLEAEALMQPAWHGSRALFNEFSTLFMSTGEGGQAFGWGLYFAQVQAVAAGYRNTLSGYEYEFTINDQPINRKTLEAAGLPGGTVVQGELEFLLSEMVSVEIETTREEVIKWIGYLIDNQNENIRETVAKVEAGQLEFEDDLAHFERQITLLQALRSGIEANPDIRFGNLNAGALYEVNVPENEELAIWDQPMSAQPPAVIEALRTIPEAVAVFGDERGFEAELQRTGPHAMTFEQFYREMGESLVGDILKVKLNKNTTDNLIKRRKQAEEKTSRRLAEAGIPGHRFLDGFSREEGEGTYNFVIYDEQRIEIAKTYRQDARGSVRFMKDKTIISLFEKADLSTVLHESGHMFLESFVKLAASNPVLQPDLEVLQRKLGFEGTNITREAHEKFAGGFERYLMDGTAPSQELRSIFQRFRAWLIAIYRRVKNKLPELDPEVREVMDRMLATDQQIRKAAALSEFEAKSAVELDLTSAEFAEYSRNVQQARNQAQDALQTSYVGEAKRLFKGWIQPIYDELKAEIRVKLLKETPYRALADLGKGRLRMDQKAFTKKYGRGAASRIPKKAWGGDMDPGTVAGILGFRSAKQFADAIADLPPLESQVESLAREQMRERYGMGDTTRAELFNALALMNMHNDARTTVLETELKALNRRAGKTDTKTAIQTARRLAEKAMNRQRVADVLTGGKFTAVYRRAGAAADRAVAAGDFATAAVQKRKQLMAHEMLKAAVAIRGEVERLRKKGLRFTRRIPDAVHPLYAQQIAEIARQYDFTKAGAKTKKPKESLVQFVMREVEAGEVFNIPASVFNQDNKVHFRHLSVEELKGVIDALDSLEHVGRRKQRMAIEKELIERNKIIDDVLAGLHAAPQRFPTDPPKTKVGEVGRAVRGALSWGHAALLKAEQLIKDLDRGDPNGPLSTYVARPIQNAAAEAITLTTDFIKPLTELYAGKPASYFAEQFEIMSLPKEDRIRTRNEIIMAALIGGTDVGLERLALTPAQFDEMIGHLTADDIKLVNGTWKILAPLQDEIRKKVARLTGVGPTKIEARSWGEFTGGWVPFTFDLESARVVHTKDGSRLFDNTMIVNALKLRQVDVTIPVVLDLNTLIHRLHDITWDLTLREPLKNAKNILDTPEVNELMRRRVGPQGVAVLDGWLQWLKQGVIQDPALIGLNRVADHLRVGVSIMTLGLNLGTAMLQPLGVFNTITEIGAPATMQGLWQFMQNPWRAHKEATDRSEFMVNRFNNVERDLQAQWVKIVHGRGESFVKRAGLFAYYLIAAIDRIFATITWHGAYNKHLKAHPYDDAGAAYYADRSVRLSQGSAAPADLVSAARANPWLKAVTMYYTWLSALYNQTTSLGQRTGRAVREREFSEIPALLANWTALIVAPAIVVGLFSEWRFEDEEEDRDAWWFLKTIALYPFASVPIVRDVAGFLDAGFPVEFSPIGKTLEEGARMIAELGDAVTGGDVNESVLMRGLIQSIGVATHLPLRPLKKLAGDWFDEAEQGEINLLELLRGQF